MSVSKATAAGVLCVAVWAVAACDSSAPSQTPQSAPPPPAATSAASTSECANAPSALVGKDLRLPVGKITAIAEGPVTVCAYAGRQEVIVRYQTGENSAEFEQAKTSQARLHQAVGTVRGLGEAAYLASYTARKPFSYTLGSLTGGIAIFITSPAPLSAERVLMTDLLKKA